MPALNSGEDGARIFAGFLFEGISSEKRIKTVAYLALKGKCIDIIPVSRYYRDMIQRQQCTRCGYTWYPRTPKLPIKCARCGSPYWNKPKWKQSGPRKIGINEQTRDKEDTAHG